MVAFILVNLLLVKQMLVDFIPGDHIITELLVTSVSVSRVFLTEFMQLSFEYVLTVCICHLSMYWLYIVVIRVCTDTK